MVRVTAAELQKQFGKYREVAIREPVSVTHHGRESLVLVSAAEFERLKQLDNRKSVWAWELDDEMKAALERSEAPDDHGKFDHEIGKK
jgi:prevent-host-death family protein